MSYPNLLKFLPVDVPPVPEPFRSGDPVAIWNYQHDPANAYNFDVLQQMLNNSAVLIGNRGAGNAVAAYNAQVKRYWQNGGPSNKYGYILPADLPELTQYYKPAENALDHYTPSPNGTGGTWAPAPTNKPIPTQPWSLPAGTVLAVVLP